MRFSMIVLAAACALIALAAPLTLPVLRDASLALLPAPLAEPAAAATRMPAVALAVVCASFWALLAMAGILLALRKSLLSRRPVDRGPTWDCGYAAGSPRMQYTASSFASPLVLLFRSVLRPRVDLQTPQGLFPARASFHSETPDVFRDYFFGPVFLSVMWVASKLRWLQQGRIQLYVLYIAVTVLSLLMWKLG